MTVHAPCFNCGEPGRDCFGYPVCDACKSKMGLFKDETIKGHIRKYAEDKRRHHSYAEEITERLAFLEKDYIRKRIKLLHVMERLGHFDAN